MEFTINTMRRSDFRHTSGFQRCIKFTLVSIAAMWLTTTTTAHAQTDYVINVSAVLNGTPVTISGSFTNEGPGFEYLANIQVIAPPFSPYGGGYIWDTCPNGGLCNYVSSNGVVAYGVNKNSTIQIGLGSGGSVNSVAITTDGTTVTDSAPTGTTTVVGHANVYGFSSNASTVLNGELEAISGNFTFDPLTDIEYNAHIQLTGLAPYAGGYFYDTEREIANSISAYPLQISFVENLSSGEDPLASVYLSSATDSAPTGFVCEVSCAITTVPEPTSLALLGAALGLFLVYRAFKGLAQ